MSEVAPDLVPLLLEEGEEEVVVAHKVELELPVLEVLFQRERRQAVHVELYRPFQQQTRGRSSHATLRPSSS